MFRFASACTPLLALLAAPVACGGVAPRTVPPPTILAPHDSGADSSPAKRLERITATAARDAGGRRTPAPTILGELDADLASALQLAVSGDHPAAIARLRSLVRMAPQDAVPSLLLARVLVEAGQAAPALEVLERLPDRAEVRALARPWRGLARLQLGELDAAAPDLREELATGTQGALAGRALARAYAALELHAEAAAILDAACVRFPGDVELAFAAAELLRDRFEREAADGALRAITGRWPEFAPAQLALAELAYERGDDAGCRAALAAMPARDLDPGTQARRVELETALVAVAAGRPRALPARTLLAAVRGGSAADRTSALGALMAAGETREAAFCAACTHGDADLRVRAIRSVPPGESRLCAYLDAVADDVDPAVRRAVADRSRELDDAASAARLLSKVLDAEEEPAAFRRAHEALVARLGPAVDLPQDGESDQRTRERVKSAWRQKSAKRTQ
ncbi:MAG: tetratricopeptide repeat protein [Planctomycetes bacterium]|nr:tetratricopeptide repeat protein [Planctomycetota bacterium]